MAMRKEYTRYAAVILITVMMTAAATVAVTRGVMDGGAADMRGVYDMGGGKTLSLLTGGDGGASRPPFYIYRAMAYEGDLGTEKGSSAPAGDDCRTLFNDDGTVRGTVVYAGGTYYYIANGREAEEIKKVDDMPVVPE